MKTYSVIKLVALSFLIISMVTLCHSAWAHGVNIFAWVEGDTVYLESKFKGGRQVKAGSIVVMDMQGHELLSGVTNEKGEFSFKIRKREDIKIVLMAGAGHQAEWILPASEMAELPATSAPFDRPASKGQRKKTVLPSHASGERKNSPQNPQYDAHELENAMEALLDRKLKPIMKMLVENQQRGPGAREILAGIGYILGLVGIVAYVQSRRRKE
jgi:nickel transport protein